MPKKIIITTLIVLITIMFPVNLKASLIPKEISQNYIIYEDDNFFIESTTTIYFLNSPLSNDRSVSKNKSVQRTNTIKNKAGKTLASYTLSATFPAFVQLHPDQPFLLPYLPLPLYTDQTM